VSENIAPVQDNRNDYRGHHKSVLPAGSSWRGVRGAEAGYELNISNTDDQLDREQQMCSLLQTRRVDGVLAVVAPNPARDVSHLSRRADAGIPVVCLDRVSSGYPLDAAVVNNRRGAAMCVRHLISLQAIAARGGSGSGTISDSRGRFSHRERLSPRQGSAAESPRPTALFTVNGTIGLGALKAVDELGLKCLKDVALAVFDEVPKRRNPAAPPHRRDAACF
jgi:LacI family transcriptional regulator